MKCQLGGIKSFEQLIKDVFLKTKVILFQCIYSQGLGCDHGRDRERATERERWYVPL